jgi:hypothetical protein
MKRIWSDGEKCPKCGGNNLEHQVSTLIAVCKECEFEYLYQTWLDKQKKPRKKENKGKQNSAS